MTRHIDQLPGEGVWIIGIDDFPPTVEKLEAAFCRCVVANGLAATAIWITSQAAATPAHIAWVKKTESGTGCDVYAQAHWFEKIDQATMLDELGADTVTGHLWNRSKYLV